MIKKIINIIFGIITELLFIGVLIALAYLISRFAAKL